MTQTAKFYAYALQRFICVLCVLVLFISGCATAGASKPIIESISPNGEWITIVEHSGDPPSEQLLLIDVKGGGDLQLTDQLNNQALTQFSPDSRYVLFGDRSMLTLLEIGTDQRIPITSTISAQFLPNGKLLLVGSTLDEFYVLDPSHLDNRVLIVDHVLYSSVMTEIVGQLLGDPLYECPTLSNKNHILQLLIDREGKVLVFDGRGVEPSIREITSDAINRLMVRPLLQIPTQEEIEKSIIKEATAQGKVLSAEQIAKAVDQRLIETSVLLAITYQSGFSPDGTKLLLLSNMTLLLSNMTDEEGDLAPSGTGSQIVYTLSLIDLTSDQEPISLFSSSQESILYFAFSPDGQQVIFETKLEDQRSLYLANVDGTNIRPVAENILGVGCWGWD